MCSIVAGTEQALKGSHQRRMRASGMRPQAGHLELNESAYVKALPQCVASNNHSISGDCCYWCDYFKCEFKSCIV